MVKKAYSFKGWKFGEWVKGNAKTIKEVLKVGIPYLISIYAFNDLALQAIITTAGKLILDSLEYYIKAR